MNLLNAPRFKVGLFAIMVTAIIAYMAVKIGDNPKLIAGGQKVHFLLPDAGGLVKGSQVKISGIPVGIIRDIRLEGSQARIELTVTNEHPIRVSAIARIKSQGILGDKYIDIYPGSPTDPPLANGEAILKIQEQGSLDKVVNQIGQVSEYVNQIASNLSEAVSEEGTNRHILGRIILNVEKLTEDLSDITGQNKRQINEIVTQLNNVTRSLDEIMNDPSGEGFKSKFKVAMNRLDNSLKNIDEITSKINNGEGTLGKLISDESTAEKVDNALNGIEDLLGAANSLQTSIDFQSQYLGNIGSSKTMVGIKLQPGLDRYYYLGIVDDPTGVLEVTDTRLTSGGSSTLTTEEKTFRNKIKFNLWFAKNFYNFSVRAGIIENTGGIGFDYSLYSERVKLSLELLEFSNLNVRAATQFNIWKGIYASLGWQDLLNKSNKFSGYLGVGLFLTNDDLKLLMTQLPMP